MTYEIIQPYQHQVYSAEIEHFDIEIDIEFENGYSTVAISSKIGDVSFYQDKFRKALSFTHSQEFFMDDRFIKCIVDISNGKLKELLSKVTV